MWTRRTSTVGSAALRRRSSPRRWSGQRSWSDRCGCGASPGLGDVDERIAAFPECAVAVRCGARSVKPDRGPGSHDLHPLLALALFAVPASTVQSDPEPAADHSWTARVHLLSNDQRVELRHLVVGNDVLVCKAPCDVAVSFLASDVFRLDGTGLRESGLFRLPPREATSPCGSPPANRHPASPESS